MTRWFRPKLLLAALVFGLAGVLAGCAADPSGGSSYAPISGSYVGASGGANWRDDGRRH